jgi:hypothetical protein
MSATIRSAIYGSSYGRLASILALLNAKKPTTDVGGIAAALRRRVRLVSLGSQKLVSNSTCPLVYNPADGFPRNRAKARADPLSVTPPLALDAPSRAASARILRCSPVGSRVVNCGGRGISAGMIMDGSAARPIMPDRSVYPGIRMDEFDAADFVRRVNDGECDRQLLSRSPPHRHQDECACFRREPLECGAIALSPVLALDAKPWPNPEPATEP